MKLKMSLHHIGLVLLLRKLNDYIWYVISFKNIFLLQIFLVSLIGTVFFYANAQLFVCQGKDSSDDEDHNDMPDDDQYDTEDSFIDDAELVGLRSYCTLY